MFKTATVSFRTRQELLELLDHFSRESKCSRSSLIETILRKFLADNDVNGVDIDKRIEAGGDMLVADGGEQPEGVVYISVGKFRIGMPKDLAYKIVFDEKKSSFQLNLLPTDERSSDITEPQKKAGLWNTAVSNMRRSKGVA